MPAEEALCQLLAPYPVPSPSCSLTQGHSGSIMERLREEFALTPGPLRLRVHVSASEWYLWEAWPTQGVLLTDLLTVQPAGHHAYLVKTVIKHLFSHCPSKGMCLTSRSNLPFVLIGRGGWSGSYLLTDANNYALLRTKTGIEPTCNLYSGHLEEA